MPFTAKSVTLKGDIALSGSIDKVFEFFSPLGEKLWVPDWDPELLHPDGASWEEGLLFRTREETGDAIWVITRLDRNTHSVTYHRVEPGRYVARINVRCRELPEQKTGATTTYTFVGLSDSGNQEIAAMTQQAYDEKMARWQRWINEYLESQRKK